MSRIPRLRLSNGGVPNNPTIFQPGNQLSRGRGRPFGSRNRTTNLVVSAITAAVLQYGAEYRKKKNLPRDADLTADVDDFKAFLLFVIDKDLRAFLPLIKGLIPKDVTLTITQPVQEVEPLPPADLVVVLEQKGLRIPPGYQLSSAHSNDDDDISEAEIIRVVDGA